MRRRAFTMIELLVAIGIIAILAGLLVLGIRSLLDTNKGEATKVTLQALQGMFGEFDAKTRLSKQPQLWRWWELSTARTLPDSSDPANATLDFWRDPFNPSSPPYRVGLDAMDAPGLLGSASGDAKDDSNAMRNGSRQILNTQAVMALLLTIPSNRAALEKLAADRLFTPQWIDGTNPRFTVSPGSDGVLYTSDDGNTQVVHYLPGARVERDGHRFLCLQAHDSSPGTTPNPSAATPNWVVDNTPAAPVLLDAWSNPIVFVPGTGLRVRLLNGKAENEPADVAQSMIIISPEGKVVRENPNNPASPPKVVQAGRPFWASAGPDGDFAKGDDNIYSFEK
jgi:prepilin-type N-terminal cleavage/methylation domain-containing protein